MLLIINDEDPDHTFNLEIRPKNVSDISCYVIVDGEEHLMEQDAQFSRLYTWSPDVPLGKPANYYFRARYKRGLYGFTNKDLGSEESPFRVEPI